MAEGFDFPKIEEKILKFWKDRKIFERTLENRANAKRFVFFDGPPFATGLPHYGHILGGTVKDLVPRFFTMAGFRVDRRWGWDCHGLPIENIIESNIGISGRKEIEKYGIDKFNKKAKEQVLKYVDEWEKIVDQTGRFIDFKNSYKTMDASYMESVWWAFAEIYKKDLVYKDSRISLYCPRCETPLSNFEIAMDNSYKDVEDETVYVKFKIKAGQKLGDLEIDDSTYILAWTTTPWTLPGNTSLAVGEKIHYVIVKKGNEYHIAAKEISFQLEPDAQTISEFEGKALLGLEYEPLFDIKYLNEGNTPNYKSAFKIVGADFVSTEEGTGIVHIAPAFGEEDFILAKKEKLPSFQTVNDSGIFFDWVEDYGGIFVFDANPLIIENLKSRGLLYKKQTIIHSYPVCYRCETKLLYKQQPAWFVAVSKIKKKMISANKKIDWHPAHLKDGRFGKGLETAPDWNVSRSRFFGTPLPIWQCEKCQEHQVIGSLEGLERYRYRGKNTYFLLRHGTRAQSHDENGEQLTASQLALDKYDLTPEGVKQIEEVAERIKEIGGLDLIFASPFLRTRHTAEIVAKKLGLDVKIDDRLKEIDEGLACEGKPRPACLPVDGKPTFDYKFGGGESWSDVRARMFSVIKEIDEKYEGKRILLVSHGDPLWLLYSLTKNLSEEETIVRRTALYIDKGELRQTDFKNYPYDEKGEVDLHRPYIDGIYLRCDKCSGKMTRLNDVFDCWFESGSMPYGQSHFPFENKKQFEDNFPADFVSEYTAQTRGWFYTMHVISTAIFGKPPFRHVVTTGNILAENGEKMSKSKNNYPDPQLLLDKYGADSLRYYLMTSPVMTADNVNFSEKGVDEVYKNFVLILINVLRFWEIYEKKYLPKGTETLRNKLDKLDIKKIEKIDEWILSRLETTKKYVTENFEKYEIMNACRAIQPFIDDLSLWYVRRNRERIKRGDKSGEAAFFTLSYVLVELSKLIAPVTPFIADHVYKTINNRKESVHLEDWPKPKKKFINPALESQMRELRDFVTLGLAQRKVSNIKVRQPLAGVTLKKSEKFEPELEKLILAELNVKSVDYNPAQEEELALDKRITLELLKESYAREVMRQIQDMRKEAKYKLDEKIYAAWASDNKDVAGAMDAFGKEIAENTLLVEFSRGHQPKEVFDVEKEFELGPQVNIWLGVRNKN